jgi:DNA ligase (NAD+)
MSSMRCVLIGWLRAACCMAGLGIAVAGWAAEPADAVDAERARWLDLRREIARHDELYFRKGAPEISDHEYDRLKRELKSLDARFADESPGKVGDDRTGEFATARHRVPMGSLAKAHSDEELAAFHARAAARLGREDVAYRVEPKYDGLAASLTYERGRLTRVVTRGDGAEGDYVTANARALVRNLPDQLRGDAAAWPELVEVRGEIFMRESEFARLNAERLAEGEPGFATPRNLAVGTLRSRDPDEIAGRNLELVCFGWGAWEGEGAGARPESLAAFRAAAEAWGLPVVAGARLATGLPELLDAVAALRDAGQAGGFPTDGVVVKLERVADQHVLGEAPGMPRWAVARKFEPPRAATRLLGVTWQVGRSGALTPVAELEPVVLAGSTVTRASLHNAAEIVRRDLRIGDRVWVEKAGEIIPAVTGVDLAARSGDAMPCSVPRECPACGREIERDAEATGPRCVNATCPARVARRLAHYVSPAALDVPGLGPVLLDAVVARGLARSPADLHRLTAAEWQSLPGVGEKKARQLEAAFATARVTANEDGARLVFALGSPAWVGRRRGGSPRDFAVWRSCPVRMRTPCNARAWAKLRREAWRVILPIPR